MKKGHLWHEVTKVCLLILIIVSDFDFHKMKFHFHWVIFTSIRISSTIAHTVLMGRLSGSDCEVRVACSRWVSSYCSTLLLLLIDKSGSPSKKKPWKIVAYIICNYLLIPLAYMVFLPELSTRKYSQWDFYFAYVHVETDQKILKKLIYGFPWTWICSLAISYSISGHLTKDTSLFELGLELTEQSTLYFLLGRKKREAWMGIWNNYK